MNIKNERNLFQEAYKYSRDYKFYIRHEMSEKQIFEIARTKYKVECVNDAWLIWQASANREGFVFVPVEPTRKMHKVGNNLTNSTSGYMHDASSIWESMIDVSQENKYDI